MKRSLESHNLLQFLKDEFDSDKTLLCKTFYNHLLANGYKEEEATTKRTTLRTVLNPTSERSFSPELQKLVETHFNLEIGKFSHKRDSRLPAYIFISAPGSSARKIFSSLRTHDLVDEISILFGDVDIFVKVYGTQIEIQEFITRDLYLIEGVDSINTSTYLPLKDMTWLRHSVENHPDYKAPIDRW